MTELNNLRDKLRSGAAIKPAEQDRARAARAGIVNRLHEQLDEAVAAAYGWPADLPPSEIVARLVALNAERVWITAEDALLARTEVVCLHLIEDVVNTSPPFGPPFQPNL